MRGRLLTGFRIVHDVGMLAAPIWLYTFNGFYPARHQTMFPSRVLRMFRPDRKENTQGARSTWISEMEYGSE